MIVRSDGFWHFMKIKLDPARGIILETERVQNRGRLTMTASFISGSEAAHRIKGLIHADTQIGKDSLSYCETDILFR